MKVQYLPWRGFPNRRQSFISTIIASIQDHSLHFPHLIIIFCWTQDGTHQHTHIHQCPKIERIDEGRACRGPHPHRAQALEGRQPPHIPSHDGEHSRVDAWGVPGVQPTLRDGDTGRGECANIIPVPDIVTIVPKPNLAGIHFTGSTRTCQTLRQGVAANIQQYKWFPRILGGSGARPLGSCIPLPTQPP